MAHKMVRQPSETPNINNIDDIVPFRYAYGNQDGYVISKGNELSYTINGNEFKINSGRVVLQGVEDDIDANGVSFTIDNIASLRYFVIYYRVNLATNTTSYEIANDGAGYPTIDAGDDLTKNSSGIANLALYRFTASSGVISSVEKVVKAIEYSGTALVGYDINKGTVEERLTRLGFRQGSTDTGEIVFNDAASEQISIDSTNINVYRQGNYVIFNLYLYFKTYNPKDFFSRSNNFVLGTISQGFRPKENIDFYISFPTSLSGSASGVTAYYYFSMNIALRINISTEGIITVSNSASLASTNLDDSVTVTNGQSGQVGYEANPIE